jgi:seryl-tRNA synthetase
MHDLSYFREHLDVYAEMAKRRNVTLDIEGFRALDKQRRELITENEKRKAQRNKASDEIARLKKEKQNADALIGEMKQVSELIKQTDVKVDELDGRQKDLLLTIPNIPHASVPYGKGAEDNKEVRRWGTPPKFDFQPKPHRCKVCGLQELGSATGTGAGEFLSGCAYAGTRIHRNPAAIPGKYRLAAGCRTIAEICGGSLQAARH